MRFTEFLRTSVLLFAGAATALAAVAIAGASSKDDRTLVYVSVSWWVIAAIVGLWLGRLAETSQGIGRLLADARHSPTLPEQEPGRTMVNRLWPLIIVIAAAAAIAFLIPQVPAIGAGYALLVALAWRKQSRAVAAIEDRDGVRFYVERSSPMRPTQLVRTPWMRRIEPTGERLSTVP
ncbi:MAG: hypothetical protein QOC55_2046 [Thermoleophilaceae bacterium]|jgi:hypothetical protein|nr:hypothetical protein [Thermoleophilaceae bacterium]